MRADLLFYTGLLGVSIGAAYWASKPSETGDDSKVKILTIEPQNIAEISFSSNQVDQGLQLVVSAKKRSDDDRFDFNVLRTETPKPKSDKSSGKNPDGSPHSSDPLGDDPGMDDEVDPSAPPKNPAADKNKPQSPTDPKAPPPQPVVTRERFLGNEKMGELLATLSPLVATRVFTNVDAKQLEEFGLKDTSQKFTIKTLDGKTYGFLLGRKSYGSPHRFVLEENSDQKSQRVLLVDNGPFENLERAPKRLYDRRFIGEEFDNITKAEIKTPSGLSAKIAHTQKNKEGQLLWTEDEADAQARPSYDSFMDRIQKLRLSQYASVDQEAKLKDLQPFLTISLEKEGKVVDVVSFKKLAGDKPQYFVTSKFLKIHGEMISSRVEPIEKDIDSVFKSKK
jgi:hypothetical protein